MKISKNDILSNIKKVKFKNGAKSMKTNLSKNKNKSYYYHFFKNKYTLVCAGTKITARG
jgi:hypothetical protein